MQPNFFAEIKAPIEHLASVQTTTTAPIETTVLTLAAVQGRFNLSYEEVHALEPVIWAARYAGPNPDRLDPPDKDDRTKAARLDRECTKILKLLGSDSAPRAALIDRYDGNIEQFYMAIWDFQLHLRRIGQSSKPFKPGAGLRKPCQILAAGYKQVTGRPCPRSDPGRPGAMTQSECHQFITWVVARFWPGREKELRTILSEL